jgi:hypothetical protein
MIRKNDRLVWIWMEKVMPSFRYFCLEGLGKTMKNSSQDSWYPD